MKYQIATPLVAYFLASVTGCQGLPFSDISFMDKPLPPGPTMAPAPLPPYQPGEFFIFDNGSTSLVTGRKGDNIEWKAGNGVTRTGRTNFLIPYLSWKNNKYRSRGSTSAPNNTLWPLKVGNKGIIEHRQRITRLDGTQPNEVTRRWECGVDGTARVNVTAGSFDTYVITCKRYAHAKPGYELRASRRYFYAPAVGHYVIREDDYIRRPDKRRELTAYGFNSTYLPKADQATLKATLQRTLDQKPDGTGTHWLDRSGKIKATLTPVRSYKGASNQKCREYHSVYNISGHIRKNVKQVCKDQKKGRWVRI
jgi:hypothetical protein